MLWFHSSEQKSIKYRFRFLLLIMPTKTFNAETDQSCGKLRRRINLLPLCLPTERVHGVTQCSAAVLLDFPSSVLPKMHTHSWGYSVGKGSNGSSQIVKISLCPVFHKLYSWTVANFLLYNEILLETWLLSLCFSIFTSVSQLQLWPSIC